MRKEIILLLVLVLSAIFSQIVHADTLSQEDTFTLPEPTGPYQVGTVTYHWTDNTPSGREFSVRFWYPADVEANASPQLYVHDSETWESIERVVSSSNLEWEDIARAEANSFADAPILSEDAPYPVLVFIHGSNAIPELWTAYIENLASHGYIVAGGYHGILSDPGEDSLFLLDQLDILNAADPEELFTGQIDLDRVGIIGVSRGSEYAISVGVEDSRVKAVVSIDGEHDTVASLNQPILIFKTSIPWSIDSIESSTPTYLINLLDSKHFDITDVTIWPWPEGKVGARIGSYELGEIDGERAVETVNAYMLAFLDEYLKDVEQPLLDGSSEGFPEAELQSHNTE